MYVRGGMQAASPRPPPPWWPARAVRALHTAFFPQNYSPRVLGQEGVSLGPFVQPAPEDMARKGKVEGHPSREQ